MPQTNQPPAELMTALAITSLPPDYRTTLYVLALSGGLPRTSLLKQLQPLGVRPNGLLLNPGNLLAQLKKLQALGWIDKAQPDSGQPVQLAPDTLLPVIADLLAAQDAALISRSLQRSMTQPQLWQPNAHLQLAAWSWLYALTGEHRALLDNLNFSAQNLPLSRFASTHPLLLLVQHPDCAALLQRFTPEVHQALLLSGMTLATDIAYPDTALYQLAQEHTQDNPASELGAQLALQALYRGDHVTFEQVGQGALQLLRETSLSLLRGQCDTCIELIELFMTSQRKQTGKRGFSLPRQLNAFYCLALIGKAEPTDYKPLKQAISYGKKERLGLAYQVLSDFLQHLQGGAPTPTPLLPKALFGMDGLLHALALHWLAPPECDTHYWKDLLLQQRDTHADNGYQWLAAEYDALLATRFATPRRYPDYHREAGFTPLVALYQRQEPWRIALHALSQISTGKAPSTSATAHDSRLVWFIALDRYGQCILEPREQKQNAKEQWSKGRPVALKRLLEDASNLSFLSEQDRQVSRLIQRYDDYYGHHYELPLDLALPRLTGHPLVFWRDPPHARLDLQAGVPSLHLQQQDEHLHLQLQPPALVDCQALLLHQETPTRLVVYSVTREIRQIADIIGTGLSVPQSAKAQLIDAIGSIAPLLPIHSDIPELTAHLDEVAADSTLYAHLLPLQEGLRLQLLVRPQADGSWLRPGQGMASLLGERDGKPVQIRRDLDAERHALEHVLAACPALALADSDGHEWQFSQAQDALQLLSELRTLDESQLRCVWPEGERMRIKARPDLRNLRLDLRQQGDWFQLQGEITLDDGRVMQLRQMLDLLRASPGRFLRLDDKDWIALDDTLRKRLGELAHLAERINDQGLRLSPLTTPLLAELADQVGDFAADAAWQQQRQRFSELAHYQPQLPSTLRAELRDYQHDGFVWLARLAHWGVGACLADDMGLGKTVQTLALLLLRAAQGPQLVVAPTSVALNWHAESSRFAPSLTLHDYQQTRSLEGLGPLDLVIVSYGLLQQDNQAFAAQHWSSVVLDEAQAIKNAQTKRSQAAMALQADFRLVATGTPLENHLGELWNLFRFINPGLLGSQDSFAQRFASPIEQGDAAARRALKALIQPFILRRLKSQVLDELPARTEITYKVPLSDAEAHQYEALRQQALQSISQLAPDAGKPMQVLAEITRLRRYCCHPSLVLPGSPQSGSKLQAFAEIVTELLENRHKALVFSQFVDHLAIVRAWLDEQGIHYQYLDGATPAKERQKRVNAFQAGEGDIFLISLKAGGSGLNLTAADYVIHLDPWWNPAVEDQASDRAHRMGQQRPVTIYRLVTENTIEEQIVALHARKRDLADSLLEGGELSGKLDADALLQLLRADSA